MQHQLLTRKLFQSSLIACACLIGLVHMQDSWESYEFSNRYSLKMYEYPFDVEDGKEIFCGYIRDSAVECLTNWIIPIGRNNTPIDMYCFRLAGFKSETVIDSIDEYCLPESDASSATVLGNCRRSPKYREPLVLPHVNYTLEFLQRTFGEQCFSFENKLRAQGFYKYFKT